jgi:hypothetical protein
LQRNCINLNFCQIETRRPRPPRYFVKKFRRRSRTLRKLFARHFCDDQSTGSSKHPESCRHASTDDHVARHEGCTHMRPKQSWKPPETVNFPQTSSCETGTEADDLHESAEQ